MLHLFCDIDNNNAIAITAEYGDGVSKRNVGVVRLLVDPDQQSGEFAIVVADDFQGSGLRWRFMETLISIARNRGLKSVYGYVLPDNYRMLKLLKEFDFTIGDEIDGERKAARELN
jgi:acetyltransferase